METLRINLLVSPDQHPELYARLAALPIKARAEQVRHLCSMGALNINAPSQVVKFSANLSTFKPQTKAVKNKPNAAHFPNGEKKSRQADDSGFEGKHEKEKGPENVCPPENPTKENTASVLRSNDSAVSSGDVFGGFDFSSMD